MIRAEEAIAVGRSMMGTPYSTYDCINFIKAILRKAQGGEKKYQTAGTNTLWRSRDLVSRQENLNNPVPGMLAFKASGEDVHHVGLVTGPATVIHSSSAKGCVVETNLLNGQWSYLAVHRLIEPEKGEGMDREDVAYPTDTDGNWAVVATESTGLRLRAKPVKGSVLMEIPKGAQVEILEEGEWPKVVYQGRTGYVLGQYLRRTGTTVPEKGSEGATEGMEGTEMTTLISREGQVISLAGIWRVAVD
ncbi:MAG: SH3 domain-containing protein [Clostridia bacterium]|nr:SH3 domain-containing protein [Clostridia bacterium]